MGLWDKLVGEFIDVIEWLDNSNDTMVYRFERHGNEIKYGAKLTVRESQIAVFVNEGQIADILEPGLYELETRNLPLLSTLQHWDHGFNSPFKAEVYFFNTRQFVNLKWGTRNPIMVRDQEFSAVRLRAFGTYAIRIADARLFINEIMGTDGHFTVDEISDQLRNLIVSQFSGVVAQSNIPVLDMAANYQQFSQYVTQQIAPDFEKYGLDLTQVIIENISLPTEVEAALDKRTSMGMVGNLDQYLQFQAAESLGKGEGNNAMDMGMGFAMANKMANSFGNATGTSAPSQAANHAPPPLPESTQWHVAINEASTGPHNLHTLQALVQKGDLTLESLVWKPGMSNWQDAASVEELQAIFRPQSPPPLPMT